MNLWHLFRVLRNEIGENGGEGGGGAEPPANNPERLGNEPKPWHDDVAEDYKEIASRYDDKNKLLKDFVNQQKLLGKRGQIKPGEDADQEAWDKFYAEAGRPESADDYDFGLDEEAEAWESELAGEYAPLAHQLGLDQMHAKKGFDLYKQVCMQNAEKQAAERTAAKSECMNTLNALHGEESSNVLNLARQVAEDKGFFESLAKSDLGNNAEFLGMLADWGKANGYEAAPGGGLGADTTQNINSRITALRESADYGKNSPAGRQIEEQLEQLYVARQKARR